MADNAPLTDNAARKAATDEVTYSGDTADVQLVRVVGTAGAEGSKTVVDKDDVQTFRLRWTAAQTDVALITVGAGTRIVLTSIAVTVDEATTVGVGVRVGFGTANTPANSATSGVVLDHDGLVPGAGMVRGDGGGILAVGADNEDLRITAEAPTSGSAIVYGSYYTKPA